MVADKPMTCPSVGREPPLEEGADDVDDPERCELIPQ